MAYDRQLTEELKEYSRARGADLIGVAPVERWAEAPVEHSPTGLMPEARTVVVTGVHFLDAPTELGAQPDPRVSGVGWTEMNAGAVLDYLCWRQVHWLESRGWRALGIPTTLLWTYRPRPGAERGWMADLCHYYAAAAAGLGEIGWHNLCITPEFGTRQRFISVVTDAPLTPDPLYEGEPLCDQCLLCAENCPTGCFEKEVQGMCTVKIEDRSFSFPHRNLWRCAIGENFGIDVFQPLPEKIDEAWILSMQDRAAAGEPELIYGWKMGQCLKWCVPPARRYFDLSYTRSPRRRRDREPDPSPEHCRQVAAELAALAERWDCDSFALLGAEEWAGQGVDLGAYLPDAESALVLSVGHPEADPLCAHYLAERAALFLGKHLQDEGFSALPRSALPAEEVAVLAGLASPGPEGAAVTERFGERQVWSAVVTGLPVGETVARHFRPKLRHQAGDANSLTESLRALAGEAGADLFGCAPAARLEAAAEDLAAYAASGADYFVVRDQGWYLGPDHPRSKEGMPFNPVAEPQPLAAQMPQDHLAGARSVIVIGLRLPGASADYAGSPPGNKAAHYQRQTHQEVFKHLGMILMPLVKYLEEAGYRAAPTFDLTGLASSIYGGGYDLTACRFAALAAGRGELGLHGLVLTPEFGARQRFAAVVTDAELTCDPVYDGPELCRGCETCLGSCPVGALSNQQRHNVTLEGRTFTWAAQDRLRCDCAKRYGLVGAEGPAWIGSTNDFALPETITPEFVCEAIRQSDRLQRGGYCPIVEACYTRCPAHSPPGA